jgi:hypothetical protein
MIWRNYIAICSDQESSLEDEQWNLNAAVAAGFDFDSACRG